MSKPHRKCNHEACAQTRKIKALLDVSLETGWATTRGIALLEAS